MVPAAANHRQSSTVSWSSESLDVPVYQLPLIIYGPKQADITVLYCGCASSSNRVLRGSRGIVAYPKIIWAVERAA